MSDSESDNELQLSAHALAALQEFKSEEQKREEEFQRLLNKADEDFERKKREEESLLVPGKE
ncbi:hypothetical protein FIM1_396 [Kluyveromyces marxianus]|uniref:FAM192A/Fyv6 N-terminal domain-containing protein n=1 Tax=Kluyveromyces marxianus TaxID=4911 RepID=A0ABX6EPX3_KLUMA|nr:hypothetical protein FIM1_396 [Kluyveromyces marxianus]